MVETILDHGVGAAVAQEPGHRQVALLCREVKRGDALSVCRTAERRLLIDAGAVVQQPCGRVQPPAGRRP